MRYQEMKGQQSNMVSMVYMYDERVESKVSCLEVRTFCYSCFATLGSDILYQRMSKPHEIY